MSNQIIDKALAYLGENSQIETTTLTPTRGQVYDTYGGLYYQKIGRLMRVHIGLKGLQANTNNTVGNIPQEYRPNHYVSMCGMGSSLNVTANGQIGTDGNIIARPLSGEFALIDIYYLL